MRARSSCGTRRQPRSSPATLGVWVELGYGGPRRVEGCNEERRAAESAAAKISLNPWFTAKSWRCSY